MTKLAHMRTAPGKEDQESPLLLRISSTEALASEIASVCVVPKEKAVLMQCKAPQIDMAYT